MKIRIKSLKHYTAYLFPVLGFLCLAAGFLLYPGAVNRTVYSRMAHCIKVLVPSLFPFIALTSYAVNSGVNTVIGRIFGFLAKYVFRLPKACTTAIIMGFVGGYPSGASGVSALLQKGMITEKQAERMLYFCVNPGVAFVISFLGGTLLQNPKTGLLLFFSVLAAGIILGFLSGLTQKVPRDTVEPDAVLSSGALIRSAFDASQAMMKMCGCIMLFSAILPIVKESGLFDLLAKSVASVLRLSVPESGVLLSLIAEISAGVSDAASVQAHPVFYAFGLGFGGICVHMQVFTFFDRFPGSKVKFFAFRFFHGILSAVLFLGFYRLFPESVTVFSSANAQDAFTGGFSMTSAGGISLLVMCAAFLILYTGGKTTVTLRKPK